MLLNLISLFILFYCSFFVQLSESIHIYPDNSTAAYCALASSLSPTLTILENLTIYCNQTIVPSLSCNVIGSPPETICGLSSDVQDYFTQLDLDPHLYSGTIPSQIGNLKDLTSM